MPSNTHKINARHVKPNHVTDDEGWTHIKKGPKAIPKSNDISIQFQNLKVDIQVSPSEISLQQQKHSKQWTNSQCLTQLQEFLEQDVLPLAHLGIDKCICLGLGSLTEGRESSKHQFATLLWMLDLLQERHSISEVIFQDPAFTKSDIAYLESLGYIVVETPRAFNAISRSTFLFAPHLERNVYASALEKAHPALCVGSDVRALLDGMKPAGPESGKHSEDEAIFAGFENEMLSRPFPEYERDTWWYFTRLYWHRSSNIEEHNNRSK